MADKKERIEREQRERETQEPAIKRWMFPPESKDNHDGENGHHVAWLRGQRLRLRLGKAEREKRQGHREEQVMQRETSPVQRKGYQGEQRKYYVEQVLHHSPCKEGLSKQAA